MNTRTKQVAAGGVAVGAIAAIIAGVYAFGSTAATAEPDVVRPASVVVEPAINPISPEDEAIAVEAREAARIAAEKEAARVAAEKAAAAEAARQAAEQQASQQQSQNVGNGDGVTDPAPAAPVRCPAGSTANSSDGVNDTSCFPDICFSIQVPDPAHPECDVAFRP